MAEPDDLHRQYLLAVLDTVEAAWRDLEARALDAWQHEVALTTWTVGLSTGALLAIGPALSVLVELADIPAWRLLLLFGAFVTAVLFGVLHRIALRIGMHRFHEYRATRLAGAMAIRLQAWTSPVQELAQAVDEFFEERDPDTQQADRATDRWDTISDALLVALYVAFFLGVAQVGWVAFDASLERIQAR